MGFALFINMQRECNLLYHAIHIFKKYFIILKDRALKWVSGRLEMDYKIIISSFEQFYISINVSIHKFFLFSEYR